MSNLLEGIRILDLTRMLAGPYTSCLLADLGAEVIKIEEPESGDEIRRMGPPFINGESVYFIAINRNKKSLTLNLKHPKGRDIFYKLVEKSDVVLDNFRPGILEKLGCNYEKIRTYNPKIISCSITSFGEEGPMKNNPAFDLVIQAYSGAMSITGEPGRPPVRMGIPLGDLAGGIFAALAISGAIIKRGQTGEGSRISISLLDALVSMLTYVAQYYFTDGKIPQPQGSKHMSCVPYGAFGTKDIYIVVAVFTERFWEKFCNAIEKPELAKDPRFDTNERRVRNRNILEPMLEEIFRTKEGSYWLSRLNVEQIPASPVNTLADVVLSEQLLSRNMIIDLIHPVAGKIKTLGYPVKVSGIDDKKISPSPLLGEHTNILLKELLSLSDKEIEILSGERVI
jgi:formyl-CoA transferase/CoA:oxalate CoA-transferase